MYRTYIAGERVAVLLCTYNGESYIKEQLESLISQTYPNFVCYIHDDCSNDNTVEVIREYENKYPEHFRLLEYDNSKHGAAENFMSLLQYVFENGNEKYYMLCDQDDVWKSQKIEKSLEYLKRYENENPCLVYCDQCVVDATLNVVARSANELLKKKIEDNSFEKIVYRNTAPGCCMVFNRKLLQVITRKMDNIVMHDWWIMLIASYLGSAYYLDEALILYRQHDKNTLGVDNNDFSKKVRKYLRNLKKSLHDRRKLARDCNDQMRMLYEMNIYSDNYQKLCQFLSNEKNFKLRRIHFLLKNGFIGDKNLFLLFFV